MGLADLHHEMSPRSSLLSRIIGEELPVAQCYALAVLLVIATACLNAVAIRWIGPSSPFLLYYPPVLVAGLFCGLGPGVLATLLATAAIFVFNVEPSFALKLPRAGDGIRLGVFVFFGVFLSYLTHLVRQTMKSLHRRDALYRLMVEEIRDYAVFMMSPEGIILTWNAGAERINGYAREEIVGQHFSRFYTPGDAPTKPRYELEEAASKGRVEDEWWRVRKDGTEFWANVVITAVRDRNGALIGFVKVARDLTERRRMEETLRVSKAALLEHTNQLEAAVADLEAFAHTVSHNLRAPLRAMQGYASLVLTKAGEKLDEECRELLERLAAASVRMDTMIRDLLAYGRVRREAQPLEPVDLAGVIAHVTRDYGHQGAEIRVRTPLESVLGHEALLTQAVSNLVENAIKFVPPGRRPAVQIWTEKVDDRIRVFVEDNGTGIKPEHYGKIFQPFVRLDPGSAGTGIGLAIVKSAVERMGGKVGVACEPGRGCRFWLDLPEVR